MTALSVSQIEPALDTFKPRLEAVHPAHQDRLVFLDIGDAHLHVRKILKDAIDLRIHAAQQDQNNTVRFIDHHTTIPVRPMFCKLYSTTEHLQW